VKAGPIRSALSQGGLRLLLIAGVISLTGDWIMRVGLAYYVYALTGSTLASALTLLASFVPQVVLGSLAGVLVDRWDSKRTIVISNLVLAAGLLPLLVVRDPNDVWIVYLVTAFEGCAQQFLIPAQQSLLPSLTDDAYLVTANALNGQTADIARLCGSAVGGVLAAAGGLATLAFADIASFLLAAVLIAKIPSARRPRAELPASSSIGGRLAQLRAEWAGGLRIAALQRVLRVVLLFIAVASVGEGIMGTLFAPFVRSVLHGGGKIYGLIVSAQAVGGIAGGLIAASAGHRVRPHRLFGWGAVAFGAIDLVLFLYPLAWPVWPPAVALMILVGVPGALMLAGALTLVQRSTDNANRGRIFGSLNAVEGVAITAGTVTAGFLGQAVGIIPVLTAQGAGYLIGGVAVLIVLGRHSAATGVTPRPQPADGPTGDRGVVSRAGC
jgi:Na+/melibiose symporter-like transporter